MVVLVKVARDDELARQFLRRRSRTPAFPMTFTQPRALDHSIDQHLSFVPPQPNTAYNRVLQ